MSEMINKVLASTAQSFTTAEQKQARDNIGAMAASASSLFYSTSNPSAFISGVSHDSNLSGNGRTTPLGLNTSIVIDRYGDSANLTYESFSLVGNGGTPLLSATRADIYMSGHAGNASSPYTANYGLQGMHIYGSDTYNHITATATLRYSGGTFVEGDDSAKIKATGMTLHTNDDGDQLVDASSVVRWNSYSSLSGFTGCSAGNNISGNGTSASPLGLNSSVSMNSAAGSFYSGTYIEPGHLVVSASNFPKLEVYRDASASAIIDDDGFTFQHSAKGIGGGVIGSRYGETLSINYNDGDNFLKHINTDQSGFSMVDNGRPDLKSYYGFGSSLYSDDSGSTWESCDASSIRRWNSGVSAAWNESANSLSTGFGGNPATAASQFNAGAGNWACRRVKCQGVPDQDLYGFQARPNGTGTAYMVNPAGAFVQYQPTYFCKLYHITGAVYEDLGTSFYPTGLTADARLDFINLCSAASANIMTDTFHGSTSIMNPGDSATMWYIASADIWTDGTMEVPV